MTDIGELEEYLSAHPADHEQRWRLAKKLYRACEYEQALHHLKLLQSEWHRKLNVLRYVAATHYRLGQHEEAIQVLEQSLEQWPGEIGAREQLARVLEVAGRREEAADVWAAIAELAPTHPLASQSVARLRKEREPSDSGDAGYVESDSGIELISGWTCPNCGASNGGEFERCWQCHASLSGTRTPTPRPLRRMRKLTSPWVSTLVTGLALVGFLCWGLFLFLRHLAAVVAGADHVLIDGTVREALDLHFFFPRAIVALVLLVVWPYLLRGALAIWKASRVPRANVTIAGLLFAACLYVVLWATPDLLPYALLVPGVLSLVVIIGTFRLGFWRGIGVWATQFAAAGCLLAVVALCFVGLAPFGQLGAIARFAEAHDAETPDGKHDVGSMRTPASFAIEWNSTGSPWLDDVVGDAVFEIARVPGTSPITAELREDGETIVSAESAETPFRFASRVAPGRQYELAVTGPEDLDVSVAVYSVLAPRRR